MKKSNIVWVIVGGMLAAIALAWLIVKRDGDGDVLDELGDFIVRLTSSEQSRLAKLQPDVQERLRELIAALDEEGLKVYIGQTLRTSAQEKSLVEEGRTSANLKVSWHQLGRAVDLYPINPDTGSADLDGKRVDLFAQMHNAAARMGWRGIAFNADGSKRLITNAKGKKIWDGGHLEWRAPYGSIAEAVASEGADFGLA